MSKKNRFIAIIIYIYIYIFINRFFFDIFLSIDLFYFPSRKQAFWKEKKLQ